jgi:putative transposase
VPIPIPWQLATDEDWRLATIREALIRPLAESTVVTIREADDVAQRLGISRSLVYELVSRFRRNRQTSSLLPQKRGLKPQAVLLSPAIDDLITKAINDFYLQRERPRISDLMREIHLRCQQQGCPTPNFRTVKRRISRVDTKEQVRRRVSASAARAQFNVVQSNSMAADLPLQIVQIDHTPIDVMVVDERGRQTIGRPWLTLVIDVATRTILGFSLSLEPPSTISVALALAHAVLPKDLWLADRELDVPWPMHGIPEVLHLDNAPEFRSDALMRGAQEYGIRIDFRPPGAPHYGGHIERLIGTTMGAVHLLPGTTFSNVAEKGSYPSEEKAALTLLELERWLALQIAGVYHQVLHSSLSISPTLAWQHGVQSPNRTPRLPADAQTFFLDFLPGERRLIRRDGIQLFNIHYWDNVLSPLAGRSQQAALIKYDPRNLSRVYYFEASGRYWPIPYRDLGRPPVSLWEQRAALKQLREEGRRLVDEKLIFDTILAQRRLVDTAQMSTRERRNQERRSLGNKMSSSMAQSADSAAEYKDLRPFEVEEWE